MVGEREKKWGVMCVNVGTPRSYRVGDVRRYLKQFLRDPRVIGPWWVRMVVGYGVPYLRAFGSAKRYRSVWRSDHNGTDAGSSPLLFYGQELVRKLACRLKENSEVGGNEVMLAMNYGEPSIESVLEVFEKKQISQIVVLPLFPHYATSSFGTAVAKIYHVASKKYVVPQLRVLSPYYDHPGFLEVEALRLKKYLHRYADEKYHVLMSYHGIPLSQCQGARGAAEKDSLPCGVEDYACCLQQAPWVKDCYRRQCVVTSQGIAARASLVESCYSTTFQSRLGPSRWTDPTTVGVLKKLCEDAHLKVLVVMFPSFISDGLETLEEIALEAREEVMKLRPDLTLVTVPCGNASEDLVDFFAQEVKELTGRGFSKL